jgi:hypothetical protein
MRSGRAILFLFLIFCNSIFFSQATTPYTLVFQPVFGNAVLALSDSSYALDSGSHVNFEILKFYISGIELINKNQTVWKEKKSFHLMDASDEKSMQILIPDFSSAAFNKIKFNIGIDSTVNVSGAMEGDLDPVKGMYWTWQSGYINFKVEGKCDVCKSRDHEFQFHLGGYQYPFNTFGTVTLNVIRDKQFTIAIDLEKLINGIDLATVDHIMSPGKEAVLLSKQVQEIFRIEAQ